MTNLLNEMRLASNNETLELLTLEKIKSLKGQRIQTIYFGYKGQDGVDDFIVGDVISEYALAKRNTEFDGYKNQAEYWKRTLSKDRLKEAKNTVVLLRKDGSSTYIKAFVDHIDWNKGIFWCSDMDRFVSFRVISDEN